LDIEACHNQNTAAIRVSETDCTPEYLYYYLFFQYQMTRTIGSGNNQKALNKERVSNMHFPLAPIDEQRALVVILESRMSIVDQVEEDINVNIQKASALRRSILKLMFSGQLINRDNNEESASALLARIRAENKKTTRGNVRSTKVAAE
jgi:type I restriction enzyme S subunit